MLPFDNNLPLSAQIHPADWHLVLTSAMHRRCAGVLVGAVMYTYNDIFFSPQGYIWVGMWYTLCVVDSVIMKHVADTVPMTTWSRTYYNVSIPSTSAARPCACFLVQSAQ